MTRYITAAAAGLVFAFTGQPSGIRLLTALAATNLTLTIWTRIRPEATNVEA